LIATVPGVELTTSWP